MSVDALLLDLLAHMCVTGEEGPIAAWLCERYPGATRVGHSVVTGDLDDDGRPLVLLVGHTDVVPPTDADRLPRREDDRIVGRGASDMKAGLAVAMACFEDAALRSGPYRLALVAYAGEEGAHDANELGSVLTDVPALRAAALAIVLEPTDLAVQLGCMGTLHAEVTFGGRAAHSARPWHGENALTKAGGWLAALHARPPRDVTVDGLVFREVLTATGAWTRNARNVVPDRFTVNLNYRFAPDKTVADAEVALARAVPAGAAVAVVDRAPAAPPRRDSPLLAGFVQAAGGVVEPKQAWTDVARLADVGIPACNYGPGLTAQAHQAGEYVPLANLDAARAVLARFLS